MRKLFLVLAVLGLMFISTSRLVKAEEGSGNQTDVNAGSKAVDVGNKICPVSVEKIDEAMKATYEYEGKIYNFCCPMCIDEFKKDTGKYISKIKEINIEAYQYGYSPDPIVVKKGDIVKFVVTSRDVTHGLYILEYGINLSVEKGKTEAVDFIADKAGEFEIKCSVYCGSGHSAMKGKFIVEE